MNFANLEPVQLMRWSGILYDMEQFLLKINEKVNLDKIGDDGRIKQEYTHLLLSVEMALDDMEPAADALVALIENAKREQGPSGSPIRRSKPYMTPSTPPEVDDTPDTVVIDDDEMQEPEITQTTTVKHDGDLKGRTEIKAV